MGTILKTQIHLVTPHLEQYTHHFSRRFDGPLKGQNDHRITQQETQRRTGMNKYPNRCRGDYLLHPDSAGGGEERRARRRRKKGDDDESHGGAEPRHRSSGAGAATADHRNHP